MISPVLRKYTFAAAIAVNTLLFPISLFVLESLSWAGLNFASGLLCWLGYYIAANEIEEQEE
tara:strand:- start:73 stop:258 length:186 start_codon:yes stop_codon:yes gene_type:complete